MEKRTKLNKLIKMRKQYNVTQSQVAQILNCTTQFYSQIERGVNTLSYTNAVKIADFFDCKPDDLFYDEFTWAKRTRYFEKEEA